MPRHSLSCALLTLTACAARPAAIEPLRGGYQFKAGEVLRYHVESRLLVDVTGSHPDFLVNGNTKPLAWDLDGEFANVVLGVDRSGDAEIERRVRVLRSSGHHADEKFGLSWSQEKDAAVPEEADTMSLLDRFAANMISVPSKIRVNGRGVSSSEELAFMRLVIRRGMMYWPVGVGELSWSSDEPIAVPILHDKIWLTFVSSITRRSGSVVRVTAPASLKEKTKGYSVDGSVTADFDEAVGRLRNLELDLRIQWAGKAFLAGGGEGDIKGVATYNETQVLIE